MPPVFGPWSPSRSRLWSWLVASGSTCVPSHITMKLASSPVRNSSITTRLPAAPKRRSPSIASIALSASSRVAKRVDDALGERRFGTDHRELDVLSLAKLDQLGRGGKRHVLDAHLGRGAAVAGRDEHLLHARALRKLPGERMLASAAADHEQLHQCLKWRTPVNTIS